MWQFTKQTKVHKKEECSVCPLCPVMVWEAKGYMHRQDDRPLLGLPPKYKPTDNSRGVATVAALSSCVWEEHSYSRMKNLDHIPSIVVKNEHNSG